MHALSCFPFKPSFFSDWLPLANIRFEHLCWGWLHYSQYPLPMTWYRAISREKSVRVSAWRLKSFGSQGYEKVLKTGVGKSDTRSSSCTPLDRFQHSCYFRFLIGHPIVFQKAFIILSTSAGLLGSTWVQVWTDSSAENLCMCPRQRTPCGLN